MQNPPLIMKTILPSLLALTISFTSIIGYAQTTIAKVPFTIKKSGSYILANDLTYSGTSTAITVEASNVTIDLSGFTLQSSTAETGNGIEVSSNSTYNGVTIQNGTISGFVYAVGLANNQHLAQNLRLLNNEIAVSCNNGARFCTIQNCFVFGGGTPASAIGVNLSPYCYSIAVKNCQLMNLYHGVTSTSPTGFGNALIGNYLVDCYVGLAMSNSLDKYERNLTIGCTYPFDGGTAVGDENN
jgi:hypothetical protein